MMGSGFVKNRCVGATLVVAPFLVASYIIKYLKISGSVLTLAPIRLYRKSAVLISCTHPLNRVKTNRRGSFSDGHLSFALIIISASS